MVRDGLALGPGRRGVRTPLPARCHARTFAGFADAPPTVQNTDVRVLAFD
jgi:hypothetical protein